MSRHFDRVSSLLVSEGVNRSNLQLGVVPVKLWVSNVETSTL